MTYQVILTTTDAKKREIIQKLRRVYKSMLLQYRLIP